jgi:ABC-type antimicrobial peptide transport system permease subunit
VRYVGTSGDTPPGIEIGRWYEIVGVVGNFPVNAVEPLGVETKIYHATTAASAYPAMLAIHLRVTAPGQFGGRLREVAAALDPSLRLQDVLSLDAVYEQEQGGMRMGALAILLVMVSVLLLSSAGLYTLMSFTVIQRQREIGIRVALGANANRILGSIFSRALRQLAIGIGLGLIVAGGLDFLAEGDTLFGQSAILLPAVALLMLIVGLLAALGPARRGLRIQPTEALKSEG